MDEAPDIEPEVEAALTDDELDNVEGGAGGNGGDGGNGGAGGVGVNSLFEPL